MAAEPDHSFEGPIPAVTWDKKQEVPPIIDKFLKENYTREHYKAMAEVVERTLNEKLKEVGVQFKLSARAKDKKSLREKLIIRHRDENKQYKDFADIKKDMVDLAGVRIILYMPTKEDRSKVKDIIQKEWGHGVVPKRHPPPRIVEEDDDDDDPKKRKYRPRHLGYRAIHYRIPMKEDGGKAYELAGYDWLENDQVEIQVVSALTHAWAEVGHDVLYKSYAYGRPSLEEERVLDALNGLIQSGDLLLEQFQAMFIRRTSQPFEHREQLTSFLRSFFNPDQDDEGLERATFPRGEGIYILFKFLQTEKLNSPMEVRRPLELLGYPFEHFQKERLIRQSFSPFPKLAPNMSLVVCLIRHLLREKPYIAPQQEKSTREMCSIMMSALTMLEFALGGPEEAKEYLQKKNMTPEQIESLNFLLDSDKRYATLEGGRDQQMVESSLQDAWNWFRTGAGTGSSFCGFLFRLAEMGCRKEVDTYTQLDQLHIGPLSRSGTANLGSDAGSNIGAALAPAEPIHQPGSEASV